jgi:hypothetical protein
MKRDLSNINETMSNFHWTYILTHPVASAMLCPSLFEERGEGRLRTSG